MNASAAPEHPSPATTSDGHGGALAHLTIAVPESLGWSTLVDELLRGVAHALNNRTTVLASLGDLMMTNGTSEARRLLQEQTAKVHDAATIVRLLAAEPGVAAEAMDVADVLQDALAIMAMHPQARWFRWSVRQTSMPRPIRAHRWMLLRSLLLMCDAARASAPPDASAHVTITIGGDARATSVIIALPGAVTPHTGTDAARYAEALGASLIATTGRLELRLPTLAELRRIQRATPAGPQ